MKRFLVAAMAIGLMTSPIVFADSLQSNDSLYPFAFETITVSSTPVGFTAATYNPSVEGTAKRALLSCETNPIRFRYDGSNPTTTTGHALAAATMINITGVNALRQFRMIASGSDSTCSVTYER